MKRSVFCLLLIFLLLLSACTVSPKPETTVTETTSTTPIVTEEPTVIEEIPPYFGEPYVVINGNVPFFTAEELTAESFETYADLDALGRCGACMASIGRDLMPTEERGNISSVKPTGWHSVQYDVIREKNLYNRCHLIGFQLTAENANKRNLITGTRYLNVDGMLPFENMVCDYVKETGNHVLYRVTPIFGGDNLVADGVEMEAQSVEDDEICFHVYCYNVQPGVVIDYATGESRLAEQTEEDTSETVWRPRQGGKKYHKTSSCSGMKDTVAVTRKEAEAAGYSPCKKCWPNQ